MREIENECEGMRVEWLIEGGQEQKQKREMVQTADRGSWLTGDNMNPAKACTLSFSKILLLGSTTARKLEGNGSNNCTGNYSIKRPIRPP